MKVQLITNKKCNFTDVTVSTLSAPRSLDEFEINVIDLSDPGLWKCYGNDTSSIDAKNDFFTIHTMVEKKCTSKIIYALPQNSTFYFYSYRDGQGRIQYRGNFLLKDQIKQIVQNIIFAILPNKRHPFSLIYENTRTTIEDQTYEADFYFETPAEDLTKSNLSNKKTTIKLADQDIYATTLRISDSKEKLLHFLSFMFESHKKETAPAWFSTVNFGDDIEQREIIKKSEAEIDAAKQKISDAKIQLEKNAEYKSILYTNGDELVRIVFEILEQLLDCDLSDFVDEKREDFLIKKESCTLIGEIKGVTSNIKNEHISQVDVHYQGYMDRLQEENQSENVHQLLIMNPFRNKEPSQREPVHELQIALAERNGCLIIETITLLHIFEKFLTGSISSEQCIAVFSNRIGLLKESDFDSLPAFNPEEFKV